MNGLSRSEFEALVDAVLGAELRSHGFRLAPQAPPEVRDPLPTAYFEAPLADFQEAFPAIASQTDADVDHVDLTVRWAPPNLSLDLEGWPLEAPSAGQSLQEQLVAWSTVLRLTLARWS